MLSETMANEERAAECRALANDGLVITCEHGGNRIPALYRGLFQAQQPLLDTHQGYDPGALVMARALAKALAAPLVASTVSRSIDSGRRAIGACTAIQPAKRLPRCVSGS